ncbi:MAE_28990/MAE_18760 family HEPN-like nuclease [Enterococcus mediterraneensis]|uniref:MAE_28990/MAE_18760 family HEPN-like nuclease n=1 Tax=Enterococcus mediterraneensis TaxID=2364791 RepID=UPI000F05A251|nr:MAE_28990/MAE_18760 family HEPN-like nuclease [Enterococcus mediterraneensis]
MNIANIEDFEDELINDLSWRKREMINLSFAVESENTTLTKSILVRAGIALLCAHWEGYIRHASNAYVLLVSSQNIKVRELRESFVTLQLTKKISEIGKSKKISVQQVLVKDITDVLDEEFSVNFVDRPGKRLINTDSNLNFDLFDEIIKVIGLDNIYETKRYYIDAMMLKNRNSIVHGEKAFFDRFDFSDLFVQVFTIMEQYKDQLIESADTQKFLKNTGS